MVVPLTCAIYVVVIIIIIIIIIIIVVIIVELHQHISGYSVILANPTLPGASLPDTCNYFLLPVSYIAKDQKVINTQSCLMRKLDLCHMV